MPPLPNPFALSYRAGDDILLEFLVRDETGAIANITGSTVLFAVGPDKDAPILTTEGSPATAIGTVTDAVNGLFQVAIAGTDTQDLLGSIPCEAALDDFFGGTATVARGYLTFTKDLV